MSSGFHRPSMGVLNLQNGEKKFQLSRHTPSDDIGFFVKHFWIVSWNLTEEEPYLQNVVPNPCVNLVIENQRSAIFGPATQKYSYFLQQKGCVFGAKFKPGGFYPFIKRSVSALREQPLSITSVFDVETQHWEESILTQSDERSMVEIAERYMRPKLPAQDRRIPMIQRMIERIVEDKEITKVDQICEQFDMNKRTLQRLFDQYVGVSPKWVIKLYRIQNAAETMDHHPNQDWLQLSLDLGYYDQSHFIKDFKSIIGKTPDEYTKGTRQP
jgi:AraC-like DNA-binding protein